MACRLNWVIHALRFGLVEDFRIMKTSFSNFSMLFDHGATFVSLM